MGQDLSKQELYEGVKTLVETDASHISLNQQKLFTLFSLAFQCMLFRSTKNPGAYIIRVEDAHLAEKLAKKSKDPSTRKFMQSLLIPRKLKFEKSVFFLDYFHMGSWNMTSEIPRDKIRTALIVKNTSSKPMIELEIDNESETQINVAEMIKNGDYYKTLREISPQTIVIAYEEQFPETIAVNFPFIKKEKEKNISGVTISSDLEWED